MPAQRNTPLDDILARAASDSLRERRRRALAFAGDIGLRLLGHAIFWAAFGAIAALFGVGIWPFA